MKMGTPIRAKTGLYRNQCDGDWPVRQQCSAVCHFAIYERVTSASAAGLCRTSHDMLPSAQQRPRATAQKRRYEHNGQDASDLDSGVVQGRCGARVQALSDLLEANGRPLKKAKTTAAGGRPAMMRRRKDLSRLLDMPLDVLYEVVFCQKRLI